MGVPQPAADDAERVALATARAERLLRAAAAETTPSEAQRAARLGRLLGDPAGRALLFSLTDEVLRATDPRRALRRLQTLLADGTPRALGPLDRAGLRLAAWSAPIAPRLVARAVEQRVRAETHGVILPADDPGFARHVARRRAAGMDLNINLLGEAILGDDEADARLDAVCARLRRNDVACVSVKISALCANLDVLAFEHSLERIADRLRSLYRVACETTPPKFVYLDMEEYRDLELTVAAFRRVLNEPEFLSLPAGLALQAYLPDSHGVLAELAAWAAVRRRRGGAWVKVRIVKGANLAMEQVEAEVAGWPQAPYCSKAEVDASYKAMLETALPAVAAGDLRVGVASHNLFDVGWALTRRDELGLDPAALEIEMLEGMAPAQARGARAQSGSLLLYAPVVAAHEYVAAIAYLSRRLDENASPDNFLRALFTLRPGSPAWERERSRFEHSVAARTAVSTAPRRTRDRRYDALRFDSDEPFANEPDTDFTIPGNREWIAQHFAADARLVRPPVVTTRDCVDGAVARANAAAQEWARTTTAERRAALTRAAEVMAANRGRTLAVMAAETGKTVREGDPEVSEAIDTARFAAVSTRLLDDLAADGAGCEPRGTVVVAGPWNFPYAIPANGVTSALAAGNAVILKPAPEAVATAAELVRHLHEASVPADVIQLLRTPDDDVGRHLITHPDIDTVVLTGAYDTARLFHSWKPNLRLIAETSGKNALVITGGADLDLAISDLVHSAFGHAGQKCSAASLAVLEACVYDDPRFLRRLADAVRSVRVGSARDLATMMGPLVKPPDGKLLRALTTLDAGERWLVEPRPVDGTGALWTPGVKLGVQPGSFFHCTECFGPVLGVMRARDLDDALALQNASEFGLTGGLHSLDPDEIEHWTERVEVGNAYVNRHLTGAIVRRQPFGGWKHSAVGPGAKTGGPNDILRFVRFTRAGTVDAAHARASHREWWHALYGNARDESGLRAERNDLRYRGLAGVVVRTSPTTGDAELAVLRDAAATTGVTMSVAPPDEPGRATARRFDGPGAWRLRALGPVDDDLAHACDARNVAIDDTPVTGHGRIELARWLHEQSISRTMHRHGRIAS